MQKTLPINLLLLLAATIILYRCANPVSPDGGPRDTTPPAVVECNPANRSTNFTARNIRISFTEFVTLKNASAEIFISPPLPKPPEPRLRGKDLLLKLEDSLHANVTYSINFGQSIVDLTEGNPLKGFSYFFSTGPYVDSLSIRGSVINAFNLQPAKNILVALYFNNNDTLPLDSLPLKLPPYYLTRTDEQGQFTLSNLQNRPFKLMAIEDQNSDLWFSQPSEKIAFIDSLVNPYYIAVPKPATPDSVKRDTTLQKKPFNPKLNPIDQRRADSILRTDSIRNLNEKYPSWKLSLFEESDSIQRIVKTAVPHSGMVVFTFRYPAWQTRITPLTADSSGLWGLRETSIKGDSVRLWLVPPYSDTLFFKVSHHDQIVDTLTIDVIKRDKKKKRNDGAIRPDRLSVTTNTGNSGFNQYRNQLVVTFSAPLVKGDLNRFLLIEGKDTIRPGCEYNDSLHRTIVVKHKWKEESSLRLLLPDSVFFGIDSLTHDTLTFDFRTRAARDLGNLVLTFNPTHEDTYIVQLMDEKEAVIYEQQTISGSGKLNFNSIPPGKFKLKAIQDRNRNGRWDTGNYRKGLQPEQVMYLQKIIELRANWDIEETWAP